MKSLSSYILTFVLIFIVHSQARAEGESTPLEVEAGFSYEALDKGFKDWTSYYLEASKKISDRKVVYGALRETERFSLVDVELMLGMYYPLGDHSTGLLEVQGSPTHKILPTWSAFIEFEHMLAHGWGVHLGLRHTDYPESFSDMGNITLERYWSNYQAVYTFSLSHVQDAGYGESHRFQAYYYYGERNRIGVGYSFGKEVEKIDQNRVEVSQVNSYTVLGRHWLDNSWAVTYEISVVEQGDIYTRRGMRVGLRRSF